MLIQPRVMVCLDPSAIREPEPMTLGQAFAAKVRLIVWCKSCGHQAKPDVATQVAQHGATMSIPDWARFLRCSICGEREVDFVVGGATPM
jgi:hypothetical protein